MSDAPIVFDNLRKEYGSFVAVNGLSLEIKRNSFTGLLGPNGAGKSTSLKVLTNLIHPTSGDAYLNGVCVTDNPKQALYGVGTVVETPEFYTYLTPRQTFRYIGEIYGMSQESISAETEEILQTVKMTEWGDKKLGTFSKGMRQRIAIGIALMNDPNIIILDEPTSGLDPQGMYEMRDILKNIRKENNDLTVLMSSHLMNEVSDLCDRVAIINHGTLLVHDETYTITSTGEVKHLLLKTVNAVDDSLLTRISGLENVSDIRLTHNGIEFSFTGTTSEESELFKAIADMGIGAYSLADNGHALEDRYLELVNQEEA